MGIVNHAVPSLKHPLADLPLAYTEHFVSIVSSPRVIGRWILAAALASTSLLAGCATPPSDPAARAVFDQTSDPLEPLNRKTFALNVFLDHVIFRPAAKVYVAVIPADGRTAVHHMLDNMKEPTLFFNNLLQGEFKRAGTSLGRFVVNSTVGFAGIVDVATLSGIERQPADFGQTLFVWGYPSGPYLVLPLLGPTNVRDAIGSAVDSYDDPFMIYANDHGLTELTTARFLVGGTEERAEVLDVLDDLEKNSVDFYAQLRSLSQQHRAAELRHGKPPEAAPDLYNDPGQPAPAPKPGAARPAPARMAARGPVTTAHPVAHPHAPAHKHVAAKHAKPAKLTTVSRCATPRCAVRGA